METREVKRPLVHLGIPLVATLALGFLPSVGLTGPLPPRPIVESDQLLPPTDLKDLPYLTLCSRKGDGTLRDPVNLALVGEKRLVLESLIRAGWRTAEKHKLKQEMHEFYDILLHRDYPRAPMSHSWLFGRREDFAFEQEVGGNPRRRHHVRIWLTPFTLRGVPVWAAAATFDKGVRAFPPDHRVAQDIDVEREFLAQGLQAAGAVKTLTRIPGVDPQVMLDARKFKTDGKVLLVELAPLPVLKNQPPNARPVGTQTRK